MVPLVICFAFFTRCERESVTDSGIVCFLNHGFSKKSGVLSHLFDVGRVLGRRFQHLFGFYLTNVDNMSDFAY